MSEPAFTEVQLSGKQLIFLFMAAVVVLVAAFLFGVSVGRGVRGTDVDTVVDLADTPAVPGTASTTPAPSPTDLTFHEMLQGKNPTASPKPETPTPALPPPAAATPPPAGAKSATAASKSEKPETSSAKPTPTPTPAPPKATPAATPAIAGWSLQTGAYQSKENADSEVSKLKAKGFTASVSVSSAGLFGVRLGPFASRAEAVAMQKKLQAEGFKSSLTR